MARGITIDSRETLVDAQVKELCDNFEDYLAEFNGNPPFKGRKLSYHKKTMRLRETLGGAAKSIESCKYMCALYDTIEVWMNIERWSNSSKGPKMQEYDEFVASIRAFKNLIICLEPVGLTQIDNDDTARMLFHRFKHNLAQMGLVQIDERDTTRKFLYMIVHGMRLSHNQDRTVMGAKVLHHLLPQLLPPIDGEYTGKFFHYSSDFQNNECAFNLMLSSFKRIAQKVCLECYVGKVPWATSESKVIDNVIIGYCIKHPDMPRGITEGIKWGRQRFT